MLKKKGFVLLLILVCMISAYAGNPVADKIIKVLKKDIIRNADFALAQQPITITAAHCERSAGGLHDFYSEGDYWWPNPDDPDGSYIQKDGLTNPDNFTLHRKGMIRFSEIIGSLASAYIITNEDKYVKHAFLHLKAWFIDTATLMNPSLLYAQAIKGKVTGRSIGVIDMIQMIEVAQGILVMEKSAAANKYDLIKIKKWFEDYLRWVTTHPYGTTERDAKNNHGTCWVMQVAVFAKLINDQKLLDECMIRFKTILLPEQMDAAGGFLLELKRTKPYGYSLFNLDAMATICQVLSNKKENLWDFELSDGRNLKNGVTFMYPFVKHKRKWPYQQDVMYWNEWPVGHPFLIFAYERFKNKSWFALWKKLEHFPENEEVIRNLPVRNPLIWINNFI